MGPENVKGHLFWAGNMSPWVVKLLEQHENDSANKNHQELQDSPSELSQPSNLHLWKFIFQQREIPKVLMDKSEASMRSPWGLMWHTSDFVVFTDRPQDVGEVDHNLIAIQNPQMTFPNGIQNSMYGGSSLFPALFQILTILRWTKVALIFLDTSLLVGLAFFLGPSVRNQQAQPWRQTQRVARAPPPSCPCGRCNWPPRRWSSSGRRVAIRSRGASPGDQARPVGCDVVFQRTC